MTHEIDYTDFINRYLENDMSQEERVWFEKEIEGNISLQQELEFYRNVNSVLTDRESIELLAQLEQIHTDIEHKEKYGNDIIKRISKNSIVVATTIIVVLFSVILINSTRDYSNDKLIGLYYQPEITKGSYRTIADSDQRLNEAIQLYESKNYHEAIKLFESVLDDNPDMIGINLYSGISYLEIQEYSTANERFKLILEQDPNPFVESATWYLGLCYLYTNEREKAEICFSELVNNDGYYADKAKKILKRL